MPTEKPVPATHRDFTALAKDAHTLSMKLYSGYEPVPLEYRRTAFALMMAAGHISHNAIYGSKSVERWNVILAQAKPKPREIIMVRAQLTMVRGDDRYLLRPVVTEYPLLRAYSEALCELQTRMQQLTTPYRMAVGDIPLEPILPPLSTITIKLKEVDRQRPGIEELPALIAELAKDRFDIDELHLKILDVNGATLMDIHRVLPTS